MTDIYLVIEVGFEGINTIYRGFLEPEKAVAYYKTLVEEKEKEAGNAEDEREKRWISGSIKRLCIRRGSETQNFECVCGELDIGPGELVLY